MSHTKGEWRAWCSDDGAFTVYGDYEKPGEVIVCLRNPIPDRAKEMLANARLIAEAPRLLDGLQHMRWCRSCAEGFWEDCEGGRAALAALEAIECHQQECGK